MEDGNEDEVRFDLVSSQEDYMFVDLLHDNNLLNQFGELEPYAHSPEAERSIETFLLKERFAINLPAIKRFIRLRKKLRPRKLEQYNSFFGEEFKLSELLQFEPADYKNHMLGKILLDMYYAFDPRATGDEE
ncbi:hypothetical protein WT59_22160 [Burkholderia territorii]|nr:hypothetical protein WT59_22160 [Burkholderia territorii]